MTLPLRVPGPSAIPDIGRRIPAALAAFLYFLQEASAETRERPQGSDGDRLLAEMTDGNWEIAGSCILLAMFEDERSGNAVALCSCPDVLPVLDDIASLHRRVVRGDGPCPKDWAEARTAAIAVTDGESDRVVAGTFAFAEAGCWNSATTRSVLVDAARPWLRSRRERAIRVLGWTADDESRAMAAFRELRASCPASETRSLGTRFGEHDPDLARRYDEQLATGHEAYQGVLQGLRRLVPVVLAASFGPSDAELGAALHPRHWMTYSIGSAP